MINTYTVVTLRDTLYSLLVPELIRDCFIAFDSCEIMDENTLLMPCPSTFGPSGLASFVLFFGKFSMGPMV